METGIAEQGYESIWATLKTQYNFAASNSNYI